MKTPDFKNINPLYPAGILAAIYFRNLIFQYAYFLATIALAWSYRERIKTAISERLEKLLPGIQKIDSVSAGVAVAVAILASVTLGVFISSKTSSVTMQQISEEEFGKITDVKYLPGYTEIIIGDQHVMTEGVYSAKVGDKVYLSNWKFNGEDKLALRRDGHSAKWICQ